MEALLAVQDDDYGLMKPSHASCVHLMQADRNPGREGASLSAPVHPPAAASPMIANHAGAQRCSVAGVAKDWRAAAAGWTAGAATQLTSHVTRSMAMGTRVLQLTRRSSPSHEHGPAAASAKAGRGSTGEQPQQMPCSTVAGPHSDRGTSAAEAGATPRHPLTSCASDPMAKGDWRGLLWMSIQRDARAVAL
jgi:hypothetical protein